MSLCLDTGECPYLCCLPAAGLIGPVTLDKIPLNWFTIYSLELKTQFFKKYVPSNPNSNPDPDPGPGPGSGLTLETRELEAFHSSLCR